jgi:pSer/pThr/pTyr-binding forkhead associated (FHA) protein
MNGSTARLVHSYGTPEEREFPLVAPTATIGRETINEIVFDDPEISRRHTRVTQLAGRFIIEDLGSTNGTFLNGRRINTPAPLANGDVIDLGGSVRLTYLGPPGAAAATVVEPSPEQLGAPATVVSSSAPEQGSTGVPTDAPYGAAQQPPQTVPDYPPAPQPQIAPAPVPEPEAAKREWGRYIIGCGCLVVLAVLACGVTVVLVDYLAPDALYCGPFQTIFEGLGFDSACS